MKRLERFLAVALVLTAIGVPAAAQSAGPDLVVGQIDALANYNPTGGLDTIAVGIISCNLGNQGVSWDSNQVAHPVFVQNAYRLAGDRFEMIGQSWATHAFLGTGQSICANCAGGTSILLGQGCSNQITPSLMGTQTRLGPRSEINPATGVFPFPPTDFTVTGNNAFKRLQIPLGELDQAVYPGAQYFVEALCVSGSDVGAGNDRNNASWREITFTGGPNNYAANFAAGSTTRLGEAALFAWRENSSGVTVRSIVVPNDGLFLVGYKGIDLGNGLFEYELAVENVSSQRAGGSFKVFFPAGANITDAGFHDVDYHSGEVYDGADWTPTIDVDSIEWRTEDFAVNPDANALRWGTIYNFRFTSDMPPVGIPVVAELGLFEPGSPSSTTVSLQPHGALNVISGNNGGGNTTEAFVEPLTVELLDTFGAPIAGAVIEFTKISGNGAITLDNGGVATTDANGIASIGVTAGTVFGAAVVEANSGDITTNFNLFVRRFGRVFVPASGTLVMQVFIEFPGLPVILAFDDANTPPTPTPFGPLCTSILSPGPMFVAKSGNPNFPVNFCSNLVTSSTGTLIAVIPGLQSLVGTGITVNHQAYAVNFSGGDVEVYISNCITATY